MRWEYRHAGDLTAWRLGPFLFGRAGRHWALFFSRWVLVSHLLLLAAACGSAGYVPKTPEAAAAYTHALATRALNVVRDAGAVASSLRQTMRALHDQRMISDATFAAFEGRRCDVPTPQPQPCADSGWLLVQRRADEAIAAVQKADVTAAQLGAALQPLYRATEALALPAAAPEEARGLMSVLMSVVRSGLALVGVTP